MTHDRNLMDEVDHDPQWWDGTSTERAEPGMKIGGHVLAVSEAEGDYGPYPVLELRTYTGELVNVSCARSVLKNEIHKHAPQTGDEIAIKYAGPATSSKGTSYEKYVVRVAHNTPTAGPAPAAPAAPRRDDGPGRITTARLDGALDNNEPF